MITRPKAAPAQSRSTDRVLNRQVRITERIVRDMSETWDTRELPVLLTVIARLEAEPLFFPAASDLANYLPELSEDEINDAAEELESLDCVVLSRPALMGWVVTGVTGRGHQAAAQGRPPTS
ncbi:hypothetical protein AB0I84_34465 [Streptomyces spectabilis]|uniref:hypothetical protein n=1 Tax=Streptomyces spectabilis TaxID=68270 RepID=UPI0033FBE72A